MVEPAALSSAASLIGDPLSDLARRVAAPLLDAVGSALVGWLARACRDVARGLFAALSGPASVDFTGGWWKGPRGAALTGTVAAIAASLTLVFLFLALLRGLLLGDPGGMLRAALGQLPLSVLGMAVVVGTTGLLVGVTDEATAAVLRGSPGDLSAFVEGFGAPAAVVSVGPVGGLLLLVFLVGALLVWAELVVRSALLYLLVAFAPLTLAARVWPSTRGAFRRLCELGVALIVSKFAIALALALGAAALGGGASAAGDPTGGAGPSLAGLLGGATLMGLAAFTPFVVLRLLPAVEAATVAHGISHSPARGAELALQAGAYPARLGRLAGASAALPVAGSSGAPRSSPLPPGAPPSGSSPTQRAGSGKDQASQGPPAGRPPLRIVPPPSPPSRPEGDRP